MHSSALGADGKIYFGGFGLRHYTGGGFGWYDPKTAQDGRLLEAAERLRGALDRAGAGAAG